MKTEYNIKLKFATCGSKEHFECSEDRSYVKCTMCGREYLEGIEEPKEHNKEVFDEIKEEIVSEAKSERIEALKNAFGKQEYKNQIIWMTGAFGLA